jgi:Mn2+/Fe2+ NRAMP family transporter
MDELTRPVTEAPIDSIHASDGDIQGAFGTIRQSDTGQRSSWRARLLTLLAVMGPGLIVMVGDNDAGGVSTYAQAGQNYGLSLLWTLPLLIPVLIVNQEMVVRLGTVTSVGHARLIKERFGKFWAAFSVADLFVLNFLTIATEFIGISLALSYFGVSEYYSVPIAGVGLIAMTATGSFRRWERFMFVFVFANFLVIPLVIFAHPHAGPVLSHYVTPGIAGGVNSTSVLFIIAIIGTTVAPWQLFFQQSNVIDKRITPRWINYERADTAIGSVITVFAATLIVATTAFAFAHHRGLAGHYTNALAVAQALSRVLGHGSGALFSIILLNASIIGAASVTLATSYAFGDIFGMQHSLHRSVKEARQFYVVFGAVVVLAAGIVLIPHAPLGLITTSVQALAGVLLPSATIFLLLLCNDPEVLGPWVNRRWLNVLASVIVAVLFGLSMVLMVTTVFPHIDVKLLVIVLAIILAVVLAAAGLLQLARDGERARPERDLAKIGWRMPPVALLAPVKWSLGKRLVMLSMGAYLVLAVALLLTKAIELGLGH